MEYHSPKRMKKRSRGFSLVSVLCMGLIGTMWVTAAYAMLIPLLQQTSGGKQALIMRTLAESAVDYVSNDIVVGMRTGQPSKFDDLDSGAPYTNFELNAAMLGIEESNNSKMRLLVTVKNQAPPILTNSAYNDLQTVNSVGQNQKKLWSMVKGNLPGWRVIEVKALSSGTATSKIAVRAILKPLFSNNSQPETSGGAVQNIFPQNTAAFATNSLSVLSNSEINGNIASNGSKDTPLGITGQNIRINGNVTVNSLQKNSSEDIVAKGNSTADPDDPGAIPPTIKGFVDTNGIVDKITTTGADNSVVVESPTSDPGRELIQQKQSIDQTGIAPAPSAPGDSIDLGSINLSGNAKLIIQDGPASIPQGQSLSNLTSGTATIPSGSYRVSNISVSDTASISVGSSSGISAPASFYVENSGIGDTAVSINGQGINTPAGNSGNFQVWYNGSRDISIGSTNASLAIYAPNASITVSGKNSANRANVTGEIVGKSIAIENANVTFDDPIAKVNNSANAGAPSTTTYDDGSGIFSLRPHGLKKVLWQELSYGEWISQGNPPF